MNILVGLGNPGEKYEKTRHNIGWRVLDAIASAHDAVFSYEKKWNAEVAKAGNILLVKPQTFMNNSGEAVRPIMDYYKCEPQDCIVLYDDKDVLFGTIRLRSTGSAGGHNGMKSLIQYIGTQDFSRVRIGIADPESPITDTAQFVLARFTADEETHMPAIITASTKAVQSILQDGLDTKTHRDIETIAKKKEQETE